MWGLTVDRTEAGQLFLERAKSQTCPAWRARPSLLPLWESSHTSANKGAGLCPDKTLFAKSVVRLDLAPGLHGSLAATGVEQSTELWIQVCTKGPEAIASFL